jgi:ANTAR domain
MEDRRRRLRSLLAVDGDGGSSALTRICALAVSELAVTGAGVTLIRRPDGSGGQQLAWATDPVAARLEDLQLTVGEGPALAAAASDAPVLVPELTAAQARWPVFTAGALAAGAAAVFAFPLILGAIRLGSLDCYRTTPGRLSADQVSDALMLAEAAFAAVLAAVAGHDPDDLGWISDIHAEVHQACGMVMYQLKITMEAALLRIRAHAYAHDLPIGEVARQIVSRQLSLHTER